MDDAERKVAVHATVHGLVQGVGYRYFIQEHAERLGLTGWVRNVPTGRTVELVAEGEHGAVQELLQLAEQGPPGSRTERVETEWIAPHEQNQTFEVRR